MTTLSPEGKEVGHTPVPWRLTQANRYDDLDPSQCHKISGKNWDTFALVATQVSEKQCAEGAANAAFIIRACNSHEALVKALEDVLANTKDGTTAASWAVDNIRKIANAALRLAKGETT